MQMRLVAHKAQHS